MKPFNMKPILCSCLLGSMLILGGCWDRTEINDLAFASGSSLDLTKDGQYLLSMQIAIPGAGPAGVGGGQGGEKFFVLSAVGRNASEAFEMIQKKSSRRLFTAHRSVIFIGESLGRHGINGVLDVFAHDPRQRLKTYIMVVKGQEAKKILETKYPFEQVPIESIKELEGLRTEISVTLRDYFISASSQGISPVMGVIETEDETQGEENSNRVFKQAGSAVFKDAKLVGFLDGKETCGFLWATDRMRFGRLNANLPNGQGNVGMLLSHTSRKIKTYIDGDKVKVVIHVEGKGSLAENNSPLDISRPKNRALAEKEFEKSVQDMIERVVAKLQKKYRVDSLGIGREIYRNHPKVWKRLQTEWETKFPEAEVVTTVKLTIEGVGMAGPPLQLKDKEIIK